MSGVARSRGQRYVSRVYAGRSLQRVRGDTPERPRSHPDPASLCPAADDARGQRQSTRRNLPVRLRDRRNYVMQDKGTDTFVYASQALTKCKTA